MTGSIVLDLDELKLLLSSLVLQLDVFQRDHNAGDRAAADDITACCELLVRVGELTEELTP